MERFIIHGGKKLSGEIEVKGAKNAALKVLAAALLSTDEVRVKNIPQVEDIARTLEILESLGASVTKNSEGDYTIQATEIKTSEINPEISKKLRASILLTAPILLRTGSVKFPHPGGCVIGERPIDIFIDSYQALGAKVTHSEDFYTITADKLIGTKIIFSQPTVTGTEAVMMAATGAEGETILKNCACEPEVESLANFLNECGADIQGAGTPVIKIKGPTKIGGGTYNTIPDRIEAGSFLILAAATGSNVKVICEPDHIDSIISTLQKMGVKLNIGKDFVEVVPPFKLTATNIKTHEYPGFPTDLQAPACVLLTQANGQALVHETIYEGRLFWLEDLKKMGADVTLYDPHRAEIKGPTKLRSWEMESPDIRAGMAYVIAALCADGESVINNVYQIDRGYEHIEERLQKIGADIKRVENER